VLDDKIKFKNQTRKQVGDTVLKTTGALDADIGRLLGLNILTLTKEQVDQLRKDIKEAEKRLGYWKTTTPNDQYIADLDDL